MLKKDRLPLFNTQPKDIEPTLEKLLHQQKNQLDQLLDLNNYTWDNFVLPIDIMEGELEDFFATVSHLNAVCNTKPLYEAYQKALIKLTEYETAKKQNEVLYQAYLSVQNSEAYQQFTPQQKKVITHILEDFKLSGITLSLENKKKFLNLSTRLSELETQFEQHVLESTDAFSLFVLDENDLTGLPKDILEEAREKAKKASKEGFLLTLDYPCYSASITHLENRSLREKIYTAYVTRASEQYALSKEWDNALIMQEILAIRSELSTLLDFKNYAEYALSKRMLKKTTDVFSFLEDLVNRLRPLAEKEMAELKAFAKTNCQLENLEPWDVAYVSEKMLEKNHALSEAMLKPYFELEKVLKGLFEVVNRLYDVSFVQQFNFNTWHPDARLFAVYAKDNQLQGHVYVDLQARSGKRSGAWVSDCRVRLRDQQGVLQLPAAYVVTNFPANASGKVLLTHEDVITLFHEFGHALHHVLTTIDYPSISGGHGVSWDAIELPSQLLEYWCWEEEALKLFAQHVDTQEPLPHDLFLKLKDTKNFNIGLSTLRQLEFGLFDFKLHVEENHDIQTVLDQVRLKTALLPVPQFNRFQNTFSHIFAGEYAAGYYSYLWSQVLAADVYETFKSGQTVFNKTVAKRFLETILSQGGSKDFMDLFMDFQGRKPMIEALLRESGLL